ncbi:MAG: RidA family protein [Eubacteriales bacterium]|nr:RidA family protein [Eubacteriales bacterium]
MSKREISTPAAPASIGPYSQAIDTGSLVFLSGQIPIDAATGKVVGDDAAAQTRQIFRNIRAVLAAVGLEPDDIVKSTVFLKDMEDFAAMNEVYAQELQAPHPARSAVQVARLPKDVLVEIEVIASRVCP